MRLLFAALFVTIGFTGFADAASDYQDDVIRNSSSFIAEHPDLKFRSRAIAAYRKARFSEAFANFRHAAKYADKPSQGMLAEMLWKGEGVDVDRVQAYAWIDLAAERAYPAMVLSREKMWSLLSETERKHAVTLGMELYEYYGDNVAKKRLESAIRRSRMNVLGSRVGYVGTSHVCLDMVGLVPDEILACRDKVDSSVFYQDKYWKSEEYWKWQDVAWQSPRTGRVDVMPIQTAPEASNSGADKK